MRENKHSQQRDQEAALWGRNETLNLMQLGAIAIGSVLLAISIMASVVTQAVTLPTAALAGEAGPLGGKVSALKVCRTKGESHIRSVSL